MKRSMLWTFLWLPLITVACAPQHVEPPRVSENGYVVSLQTEPDPIWIGTTSSQTNNHLGFGEVAVLVQDTQGRAISGVPVAFEVEPSWKRSAKLKPQQAITDMDGQARAFISPEVTGFFDVLVRVDDVLQKATFNVEMHGQNKSSGYPQMKGLPYPSPF